MNDPERKPPPAQDRTSSASSPRLEALDIFDLFPPSMLVEERPPGPPLGTAVGPNLPHREARRSVNRDDPRHPPAVTRDAITETASGSPIPATLCFHSVAHDRAAAAILMSIRLRDGVILVTGEHGIGKTTVCRAIAAELDRRVVQSLVLEPVADAETLLRTLVADFGVMSHGERARAPLAARGDCERALSTFLESLAPLQASAVVVIDDADRQPADALEALRALTAHGRAGALQVVLVAHSSFTAALQTPALGTLDASIARRVEMGPLTADETGVYIRHRMDTTGATPGVEFDDAAVQRIFDLSRGVPGIVNLICDRVLGGGFADSATTTIGAERIDAERIDAAARSIGVDAQPSSRRRVASGTLTALVLLALALAGGAAAAWVFRAPLTRVLEQWHKAPAARAAPTTGRSAPPVHLPPDDNPPRSSII